MQIFKKEKFNKLFNTPNILTLSRIGIVPIIVIFMIKHNKITGFIAALFFSIAAITDFFDGYFARQNKETSNFGKIMDPFADKILISSSYIMLVANSFIPAWVVCIIVAREFFVTTLRTLIVQNGKDASASNLGKYKVGFQIASIIPLMLHYEYFSLNMHSIGIVLLIFALIFTIWSGLDYFFKFKDSLLETF